MSECYTLWEVQTEWFARDNTLDK